MIQGATEVLARRGLHATAFSEVLALTGASRGSIYHHFPGGKAELVEAVLDDFSARLDDALRALHGRSAAAVVDGALQMWRGKLMRNDCESGCPVAAITNAADSSRLLERCQRAFSQWRDTISAALQAGGCAAPRAIRGRPVLSTSGPLKGCSVPAPMSRWRASTSSRTARGTCGP